MKMVAETPNSASKTLSLVRPKPKYVLRGVQGLNWAVWKRPNVRVFKDS